MESLEGVAVLHMSGARAVFKPAPGARISEADVTKALESQGLGLASFESKRRSVPAEIYLVDAGIT